LIRATTSLWQHVRMMQRAERAAWEDWREALALHVRGAGCRIEDTWRIPGKSTPA
jgi:hypothetical protein